MDTSSLDSKLDERVLSPFLYDFSIPLFDSSLSQGLLRDQHPEKIKIDDCIEEGW